MISPDNKKLLNDLSHTNFGRALKEYLEDEVKKLDSVSEIPEGADFETEARANKKAVKIIRKLFDFMGDKDGGEKKSHQYV